VTTTRIKLEAGEQVELYISQPQVSEKLYSTVSCSDNPMRDPERKVTNIGLRANLTITGPATVSLVKSKKRTAS
jgi:hypothetical protein